LRSQVYASDPELEYQIDLSDVSVLELVIVPDTESRSARASLKSLRLS